MGLLDQMLPSLGSGLLLGVLLVPPAAILLGLTVLTGRRKRPSRVDTIRPSEERVLILGASGASFFLPMNDSSPVEPGIRDASGREVAAKAPTQDADEQLTSRVPCWQMASARSWHWRTPVEAHQCESCEVGSRSSLGRDRELARPSVQALTELACRVGPAASSHGRSPSSRPSLPSAISSLKQQLSAAPARVARSTDPSAQR
jgi:hypothetical protein